MSTTGEGWRRFRILGMPLSAIAFLVLSALIEVVRSHYHVVWEDEFGFGLIYLHTHTSLKHFIDLQLRLPLSLDPIGFNALMHFVIRFLGSGAFVMRLPAMVGYLLMQVCLFYFVRRITSERAATFALAFPALVGMVSYSVEARPYGLLLGLSAVAMLCWQTATRRTSDRRMALVGLALALALAINIQYYAVLLFVPLGAAEVARLMERRRLDVPMLVSILAGLAGLVVSVPFASALAPFRAHHAHLPGADYHFITHCYVWLLVGYVSLSVAQQHLLGLCVAVLVAVLVVGFVRGRNSVEVRLPRAELVFLVVISLLPILGYLMANLVTHFIEARYMQPTILGLTVLLAIVIAPLLRKDVGGRILLAALFLGIAGAGWVHIQSERARWNATMASLILSPETQKNMASFAGQPIYVENDAVFQMVQYYAPSEDVRDHLTLLYSLKHDIHTGVGADISLQKSRMTADGVPNVASYESVPRDGREHVFLLYHNAWDWPDSALAEDHASIRPLGSLFGGDLVAVRFP